MFRVLGCILEQHDLRLVALAGILCLFACATTMSMIRRARGGAGQTRTAWLIGAGIVAGSGIWGTHFIAMLAYQAGFPVAYDLDLTLLSALLAMTLCGGGFLVALSRPALGGGLTGAAIGAMHYVGMAAVRAPADAVWDWRYVVASAVIGIGLMAYGMAYTLRRNTVMSYGAGALIFTVAICSMHFTGMSAVIYQFNPTVLVPNAVVEPTALAIAVAAVAVLVVALGLIGAIVDDHLASRNETEASRLRAHIVELEATQSALEQTSHSLSQALEAAAAANRAKSSFLAAMSHELRTPLNAVIGFSEMMATQVFGPLGHARYLGYANDIHGSGVHLLALINDILDLSRIDAGEGHLDESTVDLREVVAESLKLVSHQAAAAGIALDSVCDAGLPLVRADRRRLKQALINLLANAVKFTPAKGHIAVRALLHDGGPTIVVSDTGIGIAPKDIPRALEKFGQVDSSLSRKYEGAGLGLPLAKQFLELHGGTLTLESTVDIGTTVTITLPSSRIVPSAKAA
ncbi:MAG TPA: MHYT domain-containing protein [Rhizomicrobium sp.]|jgi:signal transduction histidine kinase|nr:MHYT domain-containing protein [Rhizomicrobium sp.]